MTGKDQETAAVPVGIGIDLVKINDLKDLDERTNHSFINRTFTEGEKKEAEKAANPYEYYAGRFAVKEAVYKAIVSRCSAPFDLRMIETANDETGKPFVVMSPGFREICKDADVDELLISISHEAGFAAAIAQAVGKRRSF